MQPRSPLVIDLFSGAGGFSLGADQAGFETALAVDVDSDLTSSISHNFPNTQLLQEDIATLNGQDILKAVQLENEMISGIIGGPPCQGFSMIGHQRRNDPRNSLIGHFFSIVADIKPTFFVMENVPNLLSDQFNDILSAGLNSVASDYEIVGPILVDASKFGVPTSRERVIIIGYVQQDFNPLTEDDIRALEQENGPTVFDALHDLPSPLSSSSHRDGYGWAEYTDDPDPIRGDYAISARSKPPPRLGDTLIREKWNNGKVSGFHPTNHTDRVIARFQNVNPGSTDRVSRAPRLHWEGLCPTLRAGTGRDRGSYQSIRPIHPDEPRVITIREAARLQGFPDWFLFHPTKWHSFRMIGNSVPPPLALNLLSLCKVRLNATSHQSIIS